MATLSDIKQRAVADTPLLLFRCVLTDGEVLCWSTHGVTVASEVYEARVLQHNLFEMQSLGQDGADGLGKISVRLQDVDGRLVQLERAVGFKGAKLQVQFVFFDLIAGQPTIDPVTLFLGIGSAPDEMTESALRLQFQNRMSLQRTILPTVRIQRRCGWSFPTSADERQAGVTGVDAYSRWFGCGYSADVTGGCGNLQNGTAFTSCDYSRTQCEQRGMFAVDQSGRTTARFGGVEFVPADILVRGYGESGSHVSYTQENQARFNDVVPIVYGTAWYYPPIVFARNDGNLTHLEVLLGLGELQGVRQVIANGIQIPAGQAGVSMSNSGWYNVVSLGTRNGAFNPDFTDSQGNPLGDPYGSMAVLSVVLPNRVLESGSLPKIQVLLQGMKLPTYAADSTLTGVSFTNNPAWVLLDVLRRSGWQLDEIDLTTFAAVATLCGTAINIVDNQGVARQTVQSQANVVVRKRTSAADLVRSLRTGSGLILTFGSGGKLQLRMEGPIVTQQPTKTPLTNSTTIVNGGWPAYEFGDGTDGFSDILRLPNGDPSLQFWSRPNAELANRYSVEFQDELNSFQQDSFSLVDTVDAARTGQEISATLAAVGIANYRQAAQAVGISLRKSLYGNLFASFQTSCRGFGLNPGDLITLTYPRLGLSRQLFRIVRVSPGTNFGTVSLTAQIHQDDWYSAVVDAFGWAGQPGQFALGLPRPLLGGLVDSAGQMQWAMGMSDPVDEQAQTIQVQAGFTAPSNPLATAVRVPVVSGVATVQTTGGALAGGQRFYYAVSGQDASGVEGPLSAPVLAILPAGPNTQAVVLNSLSFGPGAQGFKVYRGATLNNLQLLATVSGVAGAFTDDGSHAVSLTGPPDFNYDHANFYWRWELLPPTAAHSWTATTIANESLSLTPNAYQRQLVRLVSGTGAGQERPIAANTASSLQVASAWTVAPDTTTQFAIVETSWRLGATTKSSPATWDLPNRTGQTIHVLGRAANVKDQEDDYTLALQTRWQVSGTADQGVPPVALFGLTTQQRGTVDLAGISFSSLVNTTTITSGTLALHYVDELDPTGWFVLSTPLAQTDEALVIAGFAPGVGTLLQIEQELLVVTGVDQTSGQIQVSRGQRTTQAVDHAAGAVLYQLKRKTMILPFAKGFFGSPASGDFVQTINLPSARVVEADLYLTNQFGNGEARNVAFTNTVEQGLRTMVGGQYTLQVEGVLGIQTNAALPLAMDQTCAVRDVYAYLSQAPAVQSVIVQVTIGGNLYATLTIAAGQTLSNVVTGFGRNPLHQGAQLGVNIASVSTDPAAYPGRDLTVVVRI